MVQYFHGECLLESFHSVVVDPDYFVGLRHVGKRRFVVVCALLSAVDVAATEAWRWLGVDLIPSSSPRVEGAQPSYSKFWVFVCGRSAVASWHESVSSCLSEAVRELMSVAIDSYDVI